MNYRIGITLGYFNNSEPKDLKQSFLDHFNKAFKAYEIDELIAEVIEVEDGFVSGSVGLIFGSTDKDSALMFVQKLIKEHDLNGECWTLSAKGMDDITEVD